MHYRRKYEANKSNTESLRDENVFLKFKVITESFYLFQIPKLFIVIFQTFIVPAYKVYIIVSECISFITVFDDLNLDFNPKRHYPSWGTSAYFPRGTSAFRPHQSKCCIMIIIIMRLHSNTMLHVRARVGVCVCACARARIYACMLIILYYIIIYAGAVCVYVCGYVCAYVYVRTCMRMCMRMCVRADGRSRVRTLVRAYVCAYVCA